MSLSRAIWLNYEDRSRGLHVAQVSYYLMSEIFVSKGTWLTRKVKSIESENIAKGSICESKQVIVENLKHGDKEVEGANKRKREWV